MAPDGIGYMSYVDTLNMSGCGLFATLEAPTTFDTMIFSQQTAE
jgi:hypothetical protein